MRTLKITFSLIILTLAFQAKGQVITLEHQYENSTTCVLINDTEYKYYLMDVVGSQVKIFNLDHSPWKTIPLPTDANEYLYDIRFVSQHFFNDDDLIELLYTTYEWVASGESGYYKYNSKIYSENGEIKTNIPGGLYSYYLPIGANQYRLVCYCYDFSTTPEKVWTNVYVIENSNATPAIETERALPPPYPNPTQKKVIISYNLPDDLQKATLHLFNAEGKKITERPIDPRSTFINLSLTKLPAGIYLYHIDGENFHSETRKIILH